MRETLETPGKTCALVTPDQALGRRVAARLERWGVVPDSSAGSPLSRLPAGALVDLCARWIADPVQPHLLLAVIKHPLVRFDLGDAPQAAAVAALEEHALRGPRPATSPPCAAVCWKPFSPTGAARLRPSGNGNACRPPPAWSSVCKPPSRPRPPSSPPTQT
ncbi:hypothetical protein [Brevundimonas aurantiaca]|uniref:hypothetical protein n=1 Tax=Brevundimonas aurantiaca TaxID=74316 RepID=UPI002795EC81|nr:hypothetical protein [Brevundimonas aurantiaca]